MRKKTVFLLICLALALFSCGKKNNNLEDNTDKITQTESTDDSVQKKIIFDTKTDFIIDSQVVNKGELIIEPDTPSREGYTFLGWLYKGNYWFFSKPVETDMVLVASWKINKYKVNVENLNPECGEIRGGGTFDYNSSVTLSAHSKLGYEFLGWYDINGEKVSPESDYTFYMPSRDIKVNAKFCEREEMKQFYYCSDYNYCKITGIKDKSVESITVPDYVTSIDDGGFNGCSKLVKISTPYIVNGTFGNIFGDNSYSGGKTIEQVTNGKTKVFCIPKDLNEIIITKGISIPASAFYNFSNIESISLCNEIKAIYINAFYNCLNLKSVYYDGTINEWSSINVVSNESNPMYYANHFFVKDDEGDTNHNNVRYSSLKDITVSPSELKYQLCGFNELESLTIGNNTTRVYEGALYGCSSLINISLPFVGDMNYDISDNNKKTFGYIFGGQSYIPDSLTTIHITNASIIPAHSFENCYNVKSISLSSATTNICDSAFLNCKSIQSFYVNNNVRSIGSKIFSGCDSLSKIIVDENNTVFDSRCDCNSIVRTEDNVLIVGCKDSLIPNNVNTIMSYAFCGVKGMILIPNNIIKLGANVFEDSECTIVWGDDPKIKVIDKNTFNNYKGKRLIIPNCIEKIEEGALFGCSNLESISIPFIGDKAYTSSYTYQYPLGYIFGRKEYEGSTATIQNYIYGQYSWDKINETFYLPNTLKEVIVSECKYIQYGAFYNCRKLENIVIEESVEKIESQAFYGCSSLKSLVIPFVGGKEYTATDEYQYPLGYIFGQESFTNGIAITQFYQACRDELTVETRGTFYIPKSLFEITITGENYIPYGAFSNCNYLTEIKITNSSVINGKAFYNCTGEIVLEGNKNIKSISEREFDNYKGESILIPNTVKAIYKYAFSECSSRIVWENDSSVAFINDYAFSNYLGEELLIPDSVKFIGRHAFDNCNNIRYNEYQNADYLGNGTNPYRILVRIRDKEQTDFIIHSNCNLIMYDAFREYTYLKKVYYEGTIEKWIDISLMSSFSNPMAIASYFYILDNNGDVEYCNEKFKLLTNIFIPNGITIIGDYQFYGFSQLVSLTISNSISSIGKNAFVNCTFKLHWEDNATITTIKENAFSAYKGTELEIPESIINIDKDAFKDCTLIEKVYYNGTINQWQSIVFNNEYSNPMYYASNFYIKKDNGNIEYQSMNYELLTDLIITDGTSEIRSYQFIGFNCLESILIPKSIVEIGYKSLYMCSAKIYYKGSIEQLCNFEYSDNLSNQLGVEHFYLLDDNGNTVFNGEKYIELTKLIIPENVTSINKYQFFSFDCIEEIVLGDSVERVYGFGFAYCLNLKTIVIGKNLNKIDNNAFEFEMRLEKIFYCGTSSDWDSIDIGTGNSYLTNASIYYYTETQPAESGNYWHYVDGEVTIWE